MKQDGVHFRELHGDGDLHFAGILVLRYSCGNGRKTCGNTAGMDMAIVGLS